MWARLQVWFAIALCVAVFITFLVHKPACSSGNMLHNKPVTKFKALTTNICDKTGAMVEFSLTRLVVAPVAPQWERAAAGSGVPRLETLSSQVLSCRLNC